MTGPLDQPSITVTPQQGLTDTALRITLAGCAPHQRVTIRARMGHWRSWATFLADARGRVEVAERCPEAGTYAATAGIDLFWSLALPPAAPSGAFAETTTLAVEIVGRQVAEATVVRHFAAPDVARIPVHDGGLAGVFWQPPRAAETPAVLVLGGSLGGVRWSEMIAALLASHGHPALALAYFAAPGLPPTLAAIPLEYFTSALAWLRARIGPRRRIAVVGMSRGGELALLLGATFPAVSAVVAFAPSALRHGALDGRGAAWTHGGTSLPFVRVAQLDDTAAVAAAAIPLERIGGPILLLSGEDDRVWPSSRLADYGMARLEQARHPHPYRHVRYPQMGHAFFSPYLPIDLRPHPHPLTGQTTVIGGTAAATAVAQAAAWRETLDLLATCRP